MASTSYEVDSLSVLDDLVKQFSDPMSFFRELIQNAIDAGSGQIELRMEYEAGASSSAKGVMIAHIDDFGEGMSREIIDTKLTRLFSSSKDDDYTKIGRFGIGFVSVFAIEPAAVCVDTGRGGEFWRVLFRADRTFDLIALDEPVEGTQIRVIKAMSEGEFKAFRQRAREVVSYWCKHVRVPIELDGELLNEPFELSSLCKIEHQEEGTRIVAGFVTEVDAPYGYYNRGLTLKEGRGGQWPHVAIKIDSRYLEHTLTRDQVLEDNHFHKAKRLMELVVERLVEQLWTQVVEAAGRWPVDAQRYDGLCELLACHLSSQDLDTRKAWLEQRRVVVTLYDEPVTLARCAKVIAREGAPLYLCEAQRSMLSDALKERFLLLPLSAAHPMVRLITRYAKVSSLPLLSSTYLLARREVAQHMPGAQELSQECEALIKRLGGATMRWVGLGQWGDPSSLALLCKDHHEVQESSKLRPLGRAALLGSEEILINAADERVVKLIKIAQREPEWAAFTLIKMILLHEALTLEDDSTLATVAIERRLERQAQRGASR